MDARSSASPIASTAQLDVDAMDEKELRRELGWRNDCGRVETLDMMEQLPEVERSGR